MKISVRCHPCPGCKVRHRVAVEEADFYRWQGSYDTPGVLIQEAFPYLSNTQREMLMTGYCGPCWDREMKDLEEL